MATAPPATGTVLDVLLDEMCQLVQLTQTQFEDAKEKYDAVSGWLDREGSELHGIPLRIFPQGSVAYGTTVKPRGQDEYDVDLVLLLHVKTEDAMVIYEAVKKRLEEHDVYADLLEEKNRCLRLDYAGRFHLDILPARPDPEGDEGWILVPDKELEDWSPSNPEGFAEWFLGIANAVYAKTERQTEPLPEPEDADAKAPLQRAVQLMKRRRDVYFDGDGDGDDAPRSVVLTTLAARHYLGEYRVSDALRSILDGIKGEIRATTGILEVPNPTRSEENFAEAWDATSYRRFVEFIEAFRTELDELQGLEGLDVVTKKLEAMFGVGLASRAVEESGPRLLKARKQGQMRAGKTGITIGSAGAASGAPTVRNHEFYGSD